MSFKYVYSISADFPNEKVNEEALSYEIRTSDITIALDYIYIRDEIECEIYFKAMLSADEQIILDNIVYEHQGDPIENTITNDIGFQRMQIIDNASHITGIDDEERLKVLASVIPKEHALNGPEHTGQLDDDQIPSFIARDSELVTLSGVMSQNIADIISNYYTRTETDGFLEEKADLAHDHDLRYYRKSELDSMIITTHSGLSGLDNDDHTQYLNIERGDVRYFTQSEITTISGRLQTGIDTKSNIGHTHDDRYYTETETNGFLDQKSNINHVHIHKDLLNLERDDHPQYLLSNGTRPVTGDLVISGNLVVSGTHFISNTETVNITDNILLLNNGEVNEGVSAIQAGVEIDRGTLDNFRFVFDENYGTFAVGISGAEHPVVIREKNNLVLQEGYVPYFRYNTDSLLPHYELTVSGSIHKDNISSIQYVDSTASDLQSSIDTKAPIDHTHVENDITDLVHDAVKIRHKDVQTPTVSDDGKRLVYRTNSDSFVLESSGYGGGGVSFPFSYFYRASDAKWSSTTDYISWHTKLKLYTEEIPNGTYRVGWFYQWRLSSTSRMFMSRITVDGKEIMNSSCEPKDYWNEDMASGFRYIDLTEGEHTITLDYKVNRHNATAYIWNAELEFWRIGE